MKIEKIQFLRNVSTVFGMRFKGEEFSSPNIPEDVLVESANAKNVKVFFCKDQTNESVSSENASINMESDQSPVTDLTEERIEGSVESSEITSEIVVEQPKEVAAKKSGRPKKKK